jgi:hypothetical protein
LGQKVLDVELRGELSILWPQEKLGELPSRLSRSLKEQNA